MSNSSPLFANRMVAWAMFGLLVISTLSFQFIQPSLSTLFALQQPATVFYASSETNSVNVNSPDLASSQLAVGQAAPDVVYSSEPSAIGVASISAETQASPLLLILILGLVSVTLIVWQKHRSV